LSQKNKLIIFSNNLKIKKMKEFMMIFRMAPMGDYQPTPEEIQESMKQWQDWIGGIAAQGKFVSTNQLGFTGKTLKPGGVITDGPYAKAADIDEAVALAEGCPILFIGGHVEVRDLMEINL
jgi:hypothetical protein